MIEFDPAGSIVTGWGDRKDLGNGLHDCHVDKDSNIWIVATSGIIKKFTHDGKFLLQAEGPAMPSGIAVDPQNGDLYIADGEAGGPTPGVVVLDKTGKMLRRFQLNRAANETQIAPALHCLGFSNDGFVYVCDRKAFRVQVFDRMGKFVKNINVPWKQYTPPAGRKTTGAFGSASALDFSRDATQRLLFTTNEDNSQIEILDRNTGQHLGSFGYGAGHFPGQFTHVHGVVVDSRGNIYTSEVNTGARVQKWKIVP